MGSTPATRPGGTPHWAARVIWASTVLDRVYRAFDRVRGELVLALATDEILDGCNNLIYGAAPVYHADSPAFRPHLFGWERRAVERFFPPPPGRILIGGVGGGREAFALEEMGYEVVAFDPSPRLIGTMLTRCGERSPVWPLIGGYEELPLLRDARTGAAADLSRLAPFDAGIMGWASYSHLRSQEQREHALAEFGERVAGPILVSFFGEDSPADRVRKPGRLRRWLPGKFNQEPGNAFTVHVGFYHRVSDARLRQAAECCGLRVLYIDTEENSETWPHAVLVSAPGAVHSAPGALAHDLPGGAEACA